MAQIKRVPMPPLKDVAFIPLGRGKVAMVSTADYASLRRFRWVARKSARRWYAIRKCRVGGIEKTIRMHRQVIDAPPHLYVHHLNGNTLDNRTQNLLLVTRSEHAALHFRSAQISPARTTSGFTATRDLSNLHHAPQNSRP